MHLLWEPWPASGDLSVTATWRTAGDRYVHDANEGVATYHPAVLGAQHAPAGDFSLSARQRLAQVRSAPECIGLLGFVAGAQDPESYYVVQYAGRGLGLAIHRRGASEGGATFTLVGAAPLPDPMIGRWYDLRLDLVGDTFRVYVDGVLSLTASDPAYVGGRVGLLGYQGSSSEYRDIIVTQ